MSDLNRAGELGPAVAEGSLPGVDGDTPERSRLTARNEVAGRHGEVAGRQGPGGRVTPRSAPPAPTGPPGAGGLPTQSGPPSQGGRTGDPAFTGAATPVPDRPAIPVAREETLELSSLPAPPQPPTAPAAEPGAPRQWPSRPAPDDAAAEVWALVERAQAGDAEAFGLIYDRYLDTVFRFIYFRVGSRPLAEDLTADTFLRALKRIGSFTWQGRDLGAWLVTIARNLVADHFKSGRYRLEVTTGEVLDADQQERGPEGSPEAAVVDHITNVALLSAVKQLNPEQQECIVLRFLHGFSVAETAQAMSKNEGAIKALQYRAVRALHRLLPDGFQP